MSSTCSSFWLTTYLLCLALFNGQLAWHTVGYKLCSFSRRLVPLFIWGIFQGLLKKNEKKLARSFNFTSRNIDDVLSLNNARFSDFVDRIYPIELELKDATYKDRSASYLDLRLEIDSEGRLRAKLYDKRRWFQFSHYEISIYM